MAYVGTPLDTTNAFQSLAGKRFSGDASTTDFTLDSAPNSTLDIEVFVENVRQDPNSAYTVSGTTLAFTAAPPSGTNNIYVVHQAKSVGTIDVPSASVQSGSLNSAFFTGATDIGGAIADADLFLVDDGAGGTFRKTAASRLKTYIGSGLSETETWRVTTGANVSSGSAFFTSNWEQDDTYGAVDVGTGMTESSGVFSFPSTGIYEINFTVGFINDNGGNQAKYLVSEIHLTTDNSSYNKAAEAANSNAPEASSIYSFATTSCLFDVTNTTNDKAKFAYNVQQDFAYIGNTNYNATFATFKRLGDT